MVTTHCGLVCLVLYVRHHDVTSDYLLRSRSLFLIHPVNRESIIKSGKKQRIYFFVNFNIRACFSSLVKYYREMFKKLKQRIEEGEPPSAASSPKPIVPKSSAYVRPHGKLYRENKWEKRRVSTASLYSSKESMESDATISRSSPTSDIPSPSDLPSITNKVIVL